MSRDRKDELRFTPDQYQRFYFSRVSDPSKFQGLGPGIWCGTPRIARFVAKHLNRFLDWWSMTWWTLT